MIFTKKMNENSKVAFHRIFWLCVTLLILVIPHIIKACQPKLEIIRDDAYIVDYYESLNETACSVEVEFNRAVSSGYVEIAFYDEAGELLECDEYYLYSNSKILSDAYIIVDGKVDSYEIVSHSIEPDTGVYFLAYYFLIIAIPMFIDSLLLSYKEYEYKGNTISVYAGFYHHTLRVNGELCDEYNTIITYTPIFLETIIKPKNEGEEEILIEATISFFTNRITLKVDKKLLKIVLKK